MTSTIDFAIKINEEYAQIAPQYSEREFNDLIESIRTNGQRYAIVASKKTHEILDGHHRYRACQKLGIEPKVEFREFDTPLDEKLFVYDTNLRRNLNDFQKAEMLVNKEKLLVQIARSNSLANLKKGNSNSNNNNSPTGPNEPLGPVAVKVTQGSGQSPTTYKRARYIIENGTEHQKQILRSGKSSINAEYSYLKYVERRKQKIAEAISSPALNSNNDRYRLLLGDFRDQCNGVIADNSIDLIFTDPPYTTEYLPLYADLGNFAYRVLKAGGSLVCYAGQYAIIKIGNYVESSGLQCIWDIPVLHTGGSFTMYAYNLRVKHKPLLWFVKGSYLPIDHMQDVIESTPPDKSLHDWAQSTVEAEYIISKQTVENQIVLDPFLGTGTTAIAALKLNRKFIGIEIDEDTFNIAKSRIAEFLNLQ